MKKLLLLGVAVAALAVFGSTKTAQAEHRGFGYGRDCYYGSRGYGAYSSPIIYGNRYGFIGRQPYYGRGFYGYSRPGFSISIGTRNGGFSYGRFGGFGGFRGRGRHHHHHH